MALRWTAASFVETEKSCRRIVGYDQLWILDARLSDHEPVVEMRQAATLSPRRRSHGSQLFQQLAILGIPQNQPLLFKLGLK